ncbi:intradiol ring-cleavage dioxygenase [Altererythrobacter sp. BO-6]|uniref:intradiol ring-cleavage dioxygenase n=1 Tax=Altererythrobacter sp. BO-6 TaxID=2604537 RepID=UPI0019D2A441|nr:intradiol ring-cleavage dioxygenase [Altererythrobacter sp. BO-6]
MTEDKLYFSIDRSVDEVNSRIGKNSNPRLQNIMEVVVSHLHAAIKEVNLTTEEWMGAIQFLTETGQICSDWRQEFILLSDVLGVSMLVDAINHQRPNGSTENTVLGPFHVADAPHYPMGSNISLDGKGESMLVSGQVVDIDGKPIAGALLDVWQANDDGFYDVQQRGIQPEWNLRGVFRTGPDGKYWFKTTKPRWYPIPNDGPVGKLLEALDRHPNRPAHIHFIVTAPGHDTVVTHIFDPDCPFLSEDPVFGVKTSLIANIESVDDPDKAKQVGLSNPFLAIDWDFTLAPLEKARVTA